MCDVRSGTVPESIPGHHLFTIFVCNLGDQNSSMLIKCASDTNVGDCCYITRTGKLLKMTWTIPQMGVTEIG